MAPPTRTRDFTPSGTFSRPGAMPPGAIRATSNASPQANNYTRITLESLMNASSRELQPHLHPNKLSGALWFGVDPSVYKFVRTTWQGNFMGPWPSWKFVPQERKDKWWQAFVQNYYWESRFHDIVYDLWKVHTQITISEKNSKKKRLNKKPSYVSDDQWTTLLEYWATDAAIKRSISAAENRKSDPDGKGMHKHTAGPQNFLKIEYDMMVQSGSNEPPPYTDLVRKTHTNKKGTFVDARAESIVLEVEAAVTQHTTEDGSPNDGSQTTSTAATSRIMLNQQYIKRGQSKRGRIYGIGSVQFRDIEPKESVPASLNRSLDMEMRLSGLETQSESVNNNVETLKTDMIALKGEFKSDMAAVKEEMSATRVAINQILQTLLQTSTNVAATNVTPTTTTNITPTAATNINPSASTVAATSINPTVTSTVPSTTSALPLTPEPQSDLDKWCASLL